MRHCSTEITVTDLGSSVRASVAPCTFAAIGFGTTVLGASKVLTLSTLGAVRVSPAADLGVTPARLASIGHGPVGIEVGHGQPELPGRVPGGDRIHARQGDVAVRVGAGVEG